MNARPAALGLVLLLGVGAGCGSSKVEKASSPPVANTSAAGTGQPVSMPPDWPAELALPAGVMPTAVTDRPKQKFVVATISGGVNAVYDALRAQLKAAGYRILGDQFTPTDTGGSGSISAVGKSYTVAVTFGPDPTAGSNQVSASWRR